MGMAINLIVSVLKLQEMRKEVKYLLCKETGHGFWA